MKRDEKCKWLRIDARQTGVTYYIVKKVNGVLVKKKIGDEKSLPTIEKAREEAEWRVQCLLRGEDVSTPRSGWTLRAAFDHVCGDNKIYATSFNKNAKLIEHIKLDKITFEMIDNLHASMTKNGNPIAANRFIAIVRQVYNKMIKKRLFQGVNPAVGIEFNKESPRERFIHGDEMVRFLDYIYTHLKDKDKWQGLRMIMLALLTGARSSNICAMKWEDIDFGMATWRISAKEMKAGKAHVIGLIPEAVEFLREIKERQDTAGASRWVFPNRRTGTHVTSFKKVMITACKNAKIEAYTPHDLRRTLGSHMALNGVPLLTISKTLGHSSVNVTAKHYAHLIVDATRDGAQRGVQSIFGRSDGMLVDIESTSEYKIKK